MTDATTAQLLAQAERYLATVEVAITKMAETIRSQDARIAALEGDLHLLNNIHFDQLTARPGPPLEGTGPLPLERK